MEPIDPRDKHTDPTSNESRAPRVVALGRKAETRLPSASERMMDLVPEREGGECRPSPKP